MFGFQRHQYFTRLTQIFLDDTLLQRNHSCGMCACWLSTRQSRRFQLGWCGIGHAIVLCFDSWTKVHHFLGACRREPCFHIVSPLSAESYTTHCENNKRRKQSDDRVTDRLEWRLRVPIEMVYWTLRCHYNFPHNFLTRLFCVFWLCSRGMRSFRWPNCCPLAMIVNYQRM